LAQIAKCGVTIANRGEDLMRDYVVSVAHHIKDRKKVNGLLVVVRAICIAVIATARIIDAMPILRIFIVVGQVLSDGLIVVMNAATNYVPRIVRITMRQTH
jgi:hypothetical protein